MKDEDDYNYDNVWIDIEESIENVMKNGEDLSTLNENQE